MLCCRSVDPAEKQVVAVPAETFAPKKEAVVESSEEEEEEEEPKKPALTNGHDRIDLQPGQEYLEKILASTFLVQLRRNPNSKWGMGIDYASGKYLKIQAFADGPLAMWNNSHPDKKVEAGDFIVAINGRVGTPRELAMIMQHSHSVLNLRVIKGSLVPDEDKDK
mmetsp:Transcript_51187/g.94507  ORF Transcript_51187/g.94507 Transcript_51187/m.94507 type:complete len:165 (-) Transcript_51187:134-628(-)